MASGSGSPSKKTVQTSRSIWESESEMAAITRAFKALDKDGDGDVMPSDLISTIQELGMRFERSQVYSLLCDVDMDGEGRIQEGEFRGLMIEQVRDKDLETTGRDSGTSEFDKLWREFDREGRGYVDELTLERLFEEFGEDRSKIDCKKMIEWAKAISASVDGIETGEPGKVTWDQLHHALTAACFDRTGTAAST